MNLQFAQQPYIYSITDLSNDSSYLFSASEAVLLSCSQQFFICTRTNFQLFKLKKTYTGAQITVPASEKTLEFVNMINHYVPIGLHVLHNQNYKIAEHVRLMNEVLEEATKTLPTRINASQFSDQRYVSHIAPILENMLNSMKRFSATTLYNKDIDERKLWVSTQLKTIMGLFRRVYKNEKQANLVMITVNHLTMNTMYLSQDEVERNIAIQSQQIICELLHENETAVYHLFYRSYRDMMGGYYTEIFVVTDDRAIFTTHSIAIDHNQSVNLNSSVSQLTYMFMMKSIPLHIHGLDGGVDLDNVKQTFQQYLSSHQYLYYKSKEISPDIQVIK